MARSGDHLYWNIVGPGKNIVLEYFRPRYEYCSGILSVQIRISYWNIVGPGKNSVLEY